uniref:FATP synthase c subunit lysine N-methyltransferase n=1 Tax=Cyprinus carpio TaxID=7962 RepID=A0A8C2L5C6_CYPCA
NVAPGSAGERGFKKRLGIIACVVGGSLVSLYAVTAPFVNENALTVLKTRSGSLVDIGSGDGRIVTWREGVHHNTSFYISDLWKLEKLFSLTLRLFSPQMEQLEVKLRTELQSSAKAVACSFPFPSCILLLMMSLERELILFGFIMPRHSNLPSKMIKTAND